MTKQTKTKHTTFSLLAILAISSIVLIQMSCKKEESFSDLGLQLSFSTDSIQFDTVFTTIGSTTKQLKIYNKGNKDISISSIQLGGGDYSNFTLNVNGIPSSSVSDMEIAARDSMYIFIKVTVDPNDQSSPFVISDSIIFNIGNNTQGVKLVAWGQNAYYHTPTDTIHDWEFTFSYAGCNGAWKNDKPHLIYGYVVVDSDSSLVIPAGTQIHLHNNGVLLVWEDASLKINGEKGNEVVIQGDRLEFDYKDIPGQWGKIWLSKGSIDNEINYAVIKNGYIGLQVDSVANQNPSLIISNSIIKNMSIAGIYAQGAAIDAKNCIIANGGQYLAVFSIGGAYSFRHCTFGNYWDISSRKTPSIVLNNYYEDTYGTYHVRGLYQADFTNCIIYGTNEEELLLDTLEISSPFEYNFDHCIIKTQLALNANRSNGCIFNDDPEFSDIIDIDFHLKSSSPAIDKGIIVQDVVSDIEGVARGANPDLGAYEYAP